LLSNVNRNPYMKNKNCIKISCLADVNGVPLDIFIRKGNLNDSLIIRQIPFHSNCMFYEK